MMSKFSPVGTRSKTTMRKENVQRSFLSIQKGNGNGTKYSERSGISLETNRNVGSWDQLNKKMICPLSPFILTPESLVSLDRFDCPFPRQPAHSPPIYLT